MSSSSPYEAAKLVGHQSEKCCLVIEDFVDIPQRTFCPVCKKLIVEHRRQNFLRSEVDNRESSVFDR
jgi:hypothetical protein